MGRTLPSVSQMFTHEEEAIKRFKYALRKPDQAALDDLLISARQHLSAAAYASYVLPVFLFLLSMLLEEHKHILHLENQLQNLVRNHDRLDT